MSKLIMTCEEFCERMESEIDQIMQEQYWEGGLDSEWIWKWFLRKAVEQNVSLIDADTWSYDTYLDNVYECAEMGLS